MPQGSALSSALGTQRGKVCPCSDRMTILLGKTVRMQLIRIAGMVKQVGWRNTEEKTQLILEEEV